MRLKSALFAIRSTNKTLFPLCIYTPYSGLRDSCAPKRGILKLTRKGQTLLPEDQAGRLQAALFRTTFAKYNPAYLDRFDMLEVFAPQISLILYLIGQFCTDWREAGALMRSVVFPTRELTEPKYPDLPVFAFEARVLEYLCWFGLMEKAKPAANDDWRQPRLYRKTALYERMLRFAELR